MINYLIKRIIVKVKEIMERAGLNQTGMAIAFIKDALNEINLI